MTAGAMVALITQLIANLPATIQTGRDVMNLVNNAYESLKAAIGDREVTAEEINEIVTKIVANSAEIQSL